MSSKSISNNAPCSTTIPRGTLPYNRTNAGLIDEVVASATVYLPAAGAQVVCSCNTKHRGTSRVSPGLVPVSIAAARTSTFITEPADLVPPFKGDHSGSPTITESTMLPDAFSTTSTAAGRPCVTVDRTILSRSSGSEDSEGSKTCGASSCRSLKHPTDSAVSVPISTSSTTRDLAVTGTPSSPGPRRRSCHSNAADHLFGFHHAVLVCNASADREHRLGQRVTVEGGGILAAHHAQFSRG